MSYDVWLFSPTYACISTKLSLYLVNKALSLHNILVFSFHAYRTRQMSMNEGTKNSINASGLRREMAIRNNYNTKPVSVRRYIEMILNNRPVSCWLIVHLIYFCVMWIKLRKLFRTGWSCLLWSWRCWPVNGYCQDLYFVQLASPHITQAMMAIRAQLSYGINISVAKPVAWMSCEACLFGTACRKPCELHPRYNLSCTEPQNRVWCQWQIYRLSVQ